MENVGEPFSVTFGEGFLGLRIVMDPLRRAIVGDLTADSQGNPGQALQCGLNLQGAYVVEVNGKAMKGKKFNEVIKFVVSSKRPLHMVFCHSKRIPGLCFQACVKAARGGELTQYFLEYDKECLQFRAYKIKGDICDEAAYRVKVGDITGLRHLVDSHAADADMRYLVQIDSHNFLINDTPAATGVKKCACAMGCAVGLGGVSGVGVEVLGSDVGVC